MKMNAKYSSLAMVMAGALTAAAPAQAEMFWSDNSITLLHSGDYYNVGYEFGEPNKEMEMTTTTLEHVSGHHWGDVFFFMDRHSGKGAFGDFNETYSEISPRISSGLIGDKISAGPMKDVLLAFTYESSTSKNGEASFSQDNYLYGIGFDWDVPGFAFFQTNFFYANNENVENDLQLTVVYGAPFSLGKVDFMLDGYIDWSSGEEDHASDFHFNPQLRADVGKFMGFSKSKLEVGIEYSYWSNKFGVKTDENESAVSALVKYHL